MSTFTGVEFLYAEQSKDDVFTIIVRKINGVALEITTEKTGYTYLFVYGRRGILKYESIVVPTYRLNVYKDGNKLEYDYNVTRDAWFCLGLLPDKNGYCKLSNRYFEPPNAGMNLYFTEPTEYPKKSKLDAYVLLQNESKTLKAASHTKEMQTYVDGKKETFDDERKRLDEAENIMIHIGGWYTRWHDNSARSLAGSYGCFGLVPRAQIKTKEEAEKGRTEKLYKDFVPANKNYMIAIRKNIVELCPKDTTPKVLIQKRNSVEQLRTIRWDE